MSQRILQRKIIDYFTWFFCWLRRKKKFRIDENIVKINIGSGTSTAKDWINIDASLNSFFSTYPRIIQRMAYRLSGISEFCSEEEYIRNFASNQYIHHDVRYGLPFFDNSIDFIYSSHLIEHLYMNDAKRVLIDAYRVLKPDGIIRLSIPDLEYALSLFAKGMKDEALTFFFADSDAAYLSCHRYMYDFEMISGLLCNAGFKEIKRYPFKEGQVPDVEVLDNRPQESIFLEALK